MAALSLMHCAFVYSFTTRELICFQTITWGIKICGSLCLSPLTLAQVPFNPSCAYKFFGVKGDIYRDLME